MKFSEMTTSAQMDEWQREWESRVAAVEAWLCRRPGDTLPPIPDPTPADPTPTDPTTEPAPEVIA